MFIPLRTDAQIYHRPWATVALIAANLTVQIWATGAEDAQIDPLVLRFGEWAPWQWVTCVFLHKGWLHLIGNMLFLWVFGLVVEGKIGWWRFLALYGAIALAFGLFVQTVMLGGEGGAVGASGVIFGLIAVAMVWAPENEVECVFVLWFYVRQIELKIRDLGLIYLALEFVKVVFGGFSMGSAALHLLGAAAGLPMGIAMLKRGWVDCEGWDWFSRRDYRAMPIRVASRPTPVPSAPRPGAPAVLAPRAAAEPPVLRFAVLMRAGDIDGALRLHSECSAAERSTLRLAVRERLIHALLKAGRLADARTVIAGVLHDDPGHPGVGLVEAGLLVRESRPTKAGQVRAAISERLTSEQDLVAHAELMAQAEGLRRAGVLELED